MTAVQKNTETSSLNNIVDISSFRGPEYSDSSSPLTDLAKSDDQFDMYLKSLIEQNVYKILMMERSNRDELNNPFSSIYLCDLIPDIDIGSSVSDIFTIVEKLEDRSDEIFFDDGLD